MLTRRGFLGALVALALAPRVIAEVAHEEPALPGVSVKDFTRFVGETGPKQVSTGWTTKQRIDPWRWSRENITWTDCEVVLND